MVEAAGFLVFLLPHTIKGLLSTGRSAEWNPFIGV